MTSITLNVIALYNLGVMYQNGEGVPRNYAEAVKYYHAAADQGYVEAQYRLGEMFFKGWGVEKDYEKAVEWYRKAADQGYAEAQNWLGLMHSMGQGVPKSDVEAVKWYRMAAEQGHTVAQFNLGWKYQTDFPPDNVEAVKWYRMAAKQGSDVAQYSLGLMYEKGKGVPQDNAEAVKWYRMAAEQGFGVAQIDLGLIYKKGKGVPQDNAEAVKWYRMAAEQGYVEGQYELGEMYYHGWGIDEDKEEAAKWYQKAAEQGHPDAQLQMGIMYDFGWGIDKDKAEAVKWYRKAAEQGRVFAQVQMGIMCRHGWGVDVDEEEAVEWYRKAAEQGYAEGQYELGEMYYHGLGIDEDKEEAVKWYQKAAEQGTNYAQFKLGLMYEKGEGVPQDNAEAVKWYRKAAEQGNSNAKNSLGSMHGRGKGVPKSDVEAVKWFRMATEQEFTFVQFKLGLINEKGETVPLDNLETVKCYRMVAEQGFAFAQFKLGLIYEKGEGVPQDNAEAVKWYRMAAEQGYADAQQQLAQLKAKGIGINTAIRHLRDAEECKALLDACTPNLYMQNAFRISGIPVDASMRDIKRRIDDLKSAEEMHDLEDELSHAFALDPAPSLDQIHESAQRLQEPERRIIDEFFWFWPFEPGKCNIDPALKALMDDDKSKAIKIWSDALSDNHANKSTVAKHNLAVIYHIQALDSEQYALNNELSAEQLSTITNYWYTCFKWWEELADDEKLWSMVADRIRTIDDQRLTTGFARRMRATLPEAMDKINAMLARDYAARDKYSQATNHIKYMNETHQGKDNVPKILSIIIKPLKARVDNAVNTATSTANNKPDQAATAAFELLQVVKEPLKIIQLMLPQEDHERIDICDTVAEACLKCQTAYARTSKDWTKSIEILGAALNYAASTETKEHLKNEQSNIVTNEHIDYLNKKIDQIEKSPISISNKMNLINNDLLPHLSKMKNSLSISKDRYEKCADNVAYFLRALSVSEYNDNKHLEEALRLIDISLSIVCGNDARKKMKEDRAVLLEFQKKSVIYAYIESLSKIIDEIEKSNHNISSKMNIIQNHLFPYLAKIKNSAGMSDDIYGECADYVARYLRGLSISEFNEHNNLKAALSILDISISIACGQEERQKLQEDKAQLVNIQKETTKHNLHITIRSDEIEITNQFVRYNNQKFHISSIQGIKYGVFVQVINGIRSSSYLIDIAGGQSGSIHIECKRVLRSEGQAEQDFNGILDALFHQVIPHVVQRLAEQVVTGMPLQVGGCRLTNKGMYITTGALLWKKETLVPLSDVRFRSGSGEVRVSSVQDKGISTSMAIRDVWNAALLEFITKAVVVMKTKR